MAREQDDLLRRGIGMTSQRTRERLIQRSRVALQEVFSTTHMAITFSSDHKKDSMPYGSR